MPFVQVTMVRGRTVEQKRALIAAVSTAVAESTGTPRPSTRSGSPSMRWDPTSGASAASRTRWRGPRHPPARDPGAAAQARRPERHDRQPVPIAPSAPAVKVVVVPIAVRIATCLSTGLIPLLTACSSPHGVVNGRLIEVGGPTPRHSPVPGHVTAQGSAGTQTVMAGRDGRYTLSLPPGVYHLSGQAEGVPCLAERAIHIRRGKTISGVVVICPIR